MSRLTKALFLLAGLASVVSPAHAQQPDAPDPDRITFPRTDSLLVYSQGNPIGFQTWHLERAADGFRMTKSVQIGESAQKTTVLLGPDLTPRLVEQKGQAGGAMLDVEVRVDASGHATGQAIAPTGPSATDTVSVGVTVSEALDSNTVEPLLPGFRWASDSRFTLRVLNAAKGEVVTRILHVLGTDEVTVPAGTFEVYRVEYSSEPMPVHFMISRNAPHELVKIEIPGVPLEFVRATSEPD